MADTLEWDVAYKERRTQSTLTEYLDWERRMVQEASRATSTDSRAVIQSRIDELAPQYGLDPVLVSSLVQAESGYNPRAQSPKGAQGLMQLMPGTARQYQVRDAYDIEENLHGGMRFLADLQKRFPGRTDLQLAAYNAGPGAVDKYGGVPPYPETQQYVQKVTAGYGTGVPTGPLTVPKEVPDRGTGADTGQAIPRGRGQPIPPPGPQTTERFQPTITRLTPGQQQMMQAPGALPEGPLKLEHPLTGEDAHAIAAEFEKAGKAPARQDVSLQQSGAQLLSGAAGAAEGMVLGPLALGVVDEDTPVGQALRKLAAPFQAVHQALQAKDPTVADQVFQGIGSQLTFLVPSLGIAKGLQVAAGVTRMAGLTASAANAVMEAATEASQSYEQIRPVVGDQEAQSRAQTVFWKNASLIAVTDAGGMFNATLKPVARALSGALMEGVQEGVQYDIGRRAFWLPGNHPTAERLLQQGWQRQGDTIVVPFSPQDALTAAAIGTLIGGGTGAALGMAGSPQEQFAAAPPEVQQAAQGGNYAPFLQYLLNQRGSLGRPGAGPPGEGSGFSPEALARLQAQSTPPPEFPQAPSPPSAPRVGSRPPTMREGAEGIPIGEMRDAQGRWKIPLKDIPPEELELQDFIRQQGGIQLTNEMDLPGELRAVASQKETGLPGLQNNASGKPLGRMAEAAAEAGFIATPDKVAFLEALGRSVNQGILVYSMNATGRVPIIHDPAVAMAYQAFLGIAETLEARTITQRAMEEGPHKRADVLQRGRDLLASGQWTADDIRELLPNNPLDEERAAATVVYLHDLATALEQSAKDFVESGGHIGNPEEAAMLKVYGLVGELHPFLQGAITGTARAEGI